MNNIEKLSDNLKDYINQSIAEKININQEDECISGDTANYYLRIYKDLINEENQVNNLCDNEINNVKNAVEEFREKRIEEINNKKEYYQNMLEQYAIKQLEGKKTKTVKLPYGNLSFKKQQPKYIYDESKLIEELKEINKTIINTVTIEKVDKTKLKKEGTIMENGLFLDGHKLESVSIETYDDKFQIV